MTPVPPRTPLSFYPNRLQPRLYDAVVETLRYGAFYADPYKTPRKIARFSQHVDAVSFTGIPPPFAGVLYGPPNRIWER